MEEECTICFHPFKKGKTTSTKCSHIFCSICLNDWLTRSNCCPICSTVLKENITVDIESENINYLNNISNDSPTSYQYNQEESHLSIQLRRRTDSSGSIRERALHKIQSAVFFFSFSAVIFVVLTRD